MAINPQSFTSSRNGGEQNTDGFWYHRGKLWVRGDFVCLDGDVTLPIGSINTYEIAVNAVQQLDAYYAQEVGWTLPAAGVWTETPIQATAMFEGFIVRIEFTFPVSCPTKGQLVRWGIMVDGALLAVGALGGADAPENGFMVMANGTYYADPVNDPIGAGPHRVSVALIGPAGAQILSQVPSTLWLTEQKR